MGCPFELPSESDTPHWGGPKRRCKSTLVQPARSLPHQGGNGADPRPVGFGRLGASCQFRCALRKSPNVPPRPFNLQGRFPVSVADFEGLGLDTAGSKRCLRVAKRSRHGGAPLPVRYWLCGDWEIGSLRSSCPVGTQAVLRPSCGAGLVGCWCRWRLEAGWDAPPRHFPLPLLELSSSEGRTVLHVVPRLDMVRRSCNQGSVV